MIRGCKHQPEYRVKTGPERWRCLICDHEERPLKDPREPCGCRWSLESGEWTELCPEHQAPCLSAQEAARGAGDDPDAPPLEA